MDVAVSILIIDWRLAQKCALAVPRIIYYSMYLSHREMAQLYSPEQNYTRSVFS